jgi:hypothetical protein
MMRYTGSGHDDWREDHEASERQSERRKLLPDLTRFNEHTTQKILELLSIKNWSLYRDSGLPKEEIVSAGPIKGSQEMVKGQGHYLLPKVDPDFYPNLERDAHAILGCLEKMLVEWQQKPPTIPALDGPLRDAPSTKRVLLPLLYLRPNSGSVVVSGKNLLGLGPNKEETIFYEDLFRGLRLFVDLSTSRAYQQLVSHPETPKNPQGHYGSQSTRFC